MARLIQYANNATSTLAAGITAAATSLTLKTGEGARFPALTGSQYFMATLTRLSDGAIEVIKVTARSSDTLTIARAQEAVNGAATAYAFAAGDLIDNRLTAAALGAEFDRIETAATTPTVEEFAGAGTAGPFTLSGTPGTKAKTYVVVGGVWQNRSSYTLSGNQITLGGTVSAGVAVEITWSP